MESGVIKVDRLLGEGGMGSVYLAHDARGSPLALKVLKSQAAGLPGLREMFEQEVGILSKLKHPRLVEILGFSKSGEGIQGIDHDPCFWMEYVEGKPLLGAAKSSPTPKILQWFEESLEALEYLHSQGILHGDLKPANVLVTKEGHVKVVDFGLAALTQNLKEKGGKAQGSIPYMAPEAIDGERLPAGDLFALGTVFYEALAGKHPRAGARNLKALFSADVPKLSEKNPEVPTRTARVIERLLVPDLGGRLKSARETQEALRQEEFAPAEEVDFYAFKMLGVEAQWNQFFSFKKEIQKNKQRGLVLLHGQTGVGRSRFLRELFFESALAGDRVWQGPNRESGELLISEFSAPSTDAAKREFLVQMISGAEGLAPIQLKELYRFLREPQGLPGILILEFNDDTLDDFHRDFFSALSHQGGVLDLTLQNLSYENTKKFLQDCLRRELPEPIVAELFARTQGNATLLTETGREILQSGLLKKKNLTPELFQAMALPRSAQEIFARRLAPLSSEDRQLLKTISLGFGNIAPPALLVLTEFPLEKLRPALGRLMQAGLVAAGAEVDGESYRIAPMALPLIEQELSPEEKESIHRRWLHYLEGILSQTGASDLNGMAALAFHALRVPDAENRVQWVNQAAALYTSEENHERARRLYAQCLAGNMKPEEREPMVRALINSYGRMGRFKESLEKLEEWFREYGEAPGGLNRIKYYLSSGVSYQNEGNLREARRRLGQCIAAGDLNNPEHRPLLARAYSLLGLIDLNEGKLKQTEENFATALKNLPLQSIQAAEVLKHQALAAAKADDWETGMSRLKEAEDLYRQLNHPVGIFSVALERGNLALAMGRLEESRQSYVEAMKIAIQNKDDASLARVHQNLGVLDCRRGIFHRALRDLEKAREIFAFLGSPADRGMNLMQLALAHAGVGHFAKSEELLGLAREQRQSNEAYAERLRDIECMVAMVRCGRIPAGQVHPFAGRPEEKPKDWDLERRLWHLMLEDAQGKDCSEPIAEILKAIHGQLPDALKIGFEERGDWRRFVLKEDVSNNVAPANPHLKVGATGPGAPNNVAPAFRPGSPPPKGGGYKEGEDDMDILEKVAQITKALLSTANFDKLLVSLMDAVMELSKAAQGFLILRSDEQGGPLPGYSVKVARNMAKEDVEKEDFKVSISALKEAVEKGKPFVTDNALADTRFAQAASVHQMELKSILALPLKTPEGILGAIYLDHPYKTDIFQKTDLKVLEILVDQAALALQKARMIEQLQSSNVELSDQVKGQASELSLLKREVEDQRIKLKHEYKEVIGRSPPMLEVLSLVDRVTETMVPVWIYGESGTGKEMIARALHFNSSRAKHPFVTENCSALPETLLESELFGHVKGAFTHADRDKKGLLVHADGGTVFLDEIADMSMAMQAKLLRFLQEGEIRPLGSNQVLHVDVRVVSASNRKLQQLVADGKFREDLYYRLVGVTVTLPPLRDRLEDIPLLTQHFLKKIAKEEGKEVVEIAPDALEMLMEYRWPGNVRELENTLRTAILFHQKGKITAKSLHFKKQLTGEGEEPVAPAFRPGTPPPKGGGYRNGTGGGYKDAVPAATNAERPATGAPGLTEEKRLLLKALFDSGYHKGHAAKALGISRRYLYTQLLRHQVPVNRIEMKAYIENKLNM